MCLQLLANVQLPRAIGGLDGTGILLDSEGGCSFKRMDEICKATANLGARACGAKWSQKNLLDGILYRRIDTIEELNNCLDELARQILPNGPNVKLLVVDSIAYLFRYPISENEPNTKSTLHSIIQRLNYLSHQWNLVVVVTNQMTTKLSQLGEEEDCEDEIIPALGEAWSHVCSTNLCLKYVQVPHSQMRMMEIVKSSHLERGQAYFCVTHEGIRDAPASTG